MSLNIDLKIAFVFLLFVTVSTVLRFVFLINPNFKDITELGRLLLPCIVLFYSHTFREFDFADLIRIMFWITIVDFSVSTMEFFYQTTGDTAVYKTVRSLYWSEGHWVSPYRTNGLTPGPGQHAVFGVFVYVLALSNLVFNKTKNLKLGILFLIISFFVTITSLSRTGTIVLMAVSFAALSIYLLSLKKRDVFKFSLFLTFVMLLLSKFVSANMDRLGRVLELAEKGLNNGTIAGRQENWNELLLVAWARPEFILTGWGKQYFGDLALQTDNEFLFIILFYGVLTFMLFLYFTGRYVLRYLTNSQKTKPERITIFLLILAGYLFAIPSAFFFQVQTLVIGAVLVIIYRKNNIKRHLPCTTE